ncbi:MAG: epoxyqueuosine reductase QueH [Dehalococcoidales bacterium]|nr:epoxyqueuosine reductase QueH [Dehalococcoidales bacterium]
MKIILHICCGVCAAGAAERLISEGHQVTGYFFNPNIHPSEEYLLRLKAAENIAGGMGFPLVDSLYNPHEWLENTATLTKEPEGGKRCEVCFRMRLKETYDYMQKMGFDAFTTTLTIGPQKSAEIVNRIGKEIGRDKFLVRDFKKQGGFQRANELAKKFQIYRQNYCGCIYSIRKK